jgi:aldose 1-epimerase
MLVPSGRQVTLSDGDQELVVVEVGGGIRSYRAGGEDVIDGYDAGEVCTGGRGQLLAPWPNRVQDGAFAWAGRPHQLPLSEPENGNAIHGLVRWLPWRVGDISRSACRLTCTLHPQPGWDWLVDLEVLYRIDVSGLTVTTSATNAAGGEPCPFGLGWHPYLAAFGGLVDDVVLRLPASTAYEADGRGIPTGAFGVGGTDYDFRHGRLIGDARLDTAFSGLARDAEERAVVELSHPPTGRTVRLWMDRSFTHAMVYSGDTLGEQDRRRRGLAVEPMTCAPDMLRNGDGLRVLEPGETFEASWGVVPATALWG